MPDPHSQAVPTSSATPAERAGVDEIVIRPPRFVSPLRVRELYEYRETLFRKVIQKVRVQYDEMLLGFFWAVARPVIMTAIFWGFRDLSSAQVGVSISYTVYLYTGLVLWYHFVQATMAVTTGLKGDSGLIQKIYFPRLLSPLASLFAETYNLFLAVVPLAILMVLTGDYPGWRIVLFPIVLGQMMLLTLGLGLLFSSLVLYSRDWERFLRFALYAGLWMSPVVYSVHIIPDDKQLLYHANPMVGTLLALRSTLFANFDFPLLPWLYSLGVSLVLTVIGVFAFQRTERVVADRV